MELIGVELGRSGFESYVSYFPSYVSFLNLFPPPLNSNTCACLFLSPGPHIMGIHNMGCMCKS